MLIDAEDNEDDPTLPSDATAQAAAHLQPLSLCLVWSVFQRCIDLPDQLALWIRH